MRGFDSNNDPLSEQELLELEELLVSNELPSGSMNLDALDGFLTALVVGPVAIAPEEWIPVVFGSEPDGISSEGSAEKTMQRIAALALRYRNTIAVIFRQDPETFRPLFELSTYACDEDAECAVQEWAHAFMIGIEMRYEDWVPLIEMAEMTDEEGEQTAMLLGPLLLLSGRDPRSESLSGDQREQLGKMVAESISDIYRFWLPFREMNEDDCQ
ncbi:MAG: UPF0149 family protein [Chlorobiaceae bacterium]|nr:UPF0149 family protein [Chlorobiaceae bacterium]